MLEFVFNLFPERLEYCRTINGYRSAISAYHEKADGITTGQHPKICQPLSVVFSKRPPQPKYTIIWDMSKVIGYIRTYIGTYLDIRHIAFKEK